MTRKKKLKAVNLLELVVSISIITILFTGGFSVFNLSLRTIERARQHTLAELLTHDLIELTISKRNEDWNSLVPGEYYFVEDPDPEIGLTFVSGQEIIDEFTRSVTISAVYRNAVSGNIVTSGGELDSNTLRIDALTTWEYRGDAKQIQLSQYLTNWKNF